MPAKIFLTDADGFAANSEPAFVILHISRKEIEACAIASALERLHVLTDTRAAVLEYRESLAFVVSGYDTESRELAEIPEVRAYFSRLSSEWPHWLWFLSRGTGSIPLLLSLLSRVRILRQGRKFSTEFADLDGVRAVLHDLFRRGNALFAAYDIAVADVAESATTAVREVL